MTWASALLGTPICIPNICQTSSMDCTSEFEVHLCADEQCLHRHQCGRYQTEDGSVRAGYVGVLLHKMSQMTIDDLQTRCDRMMWRCFSFSCHIYRTPGPYGLVYFNALFMVLPTGLLCLSSGELVETLDFPLLRDPIFLVHLLASCVMGFLLVGYTSIS